MNTIDQMEKLDTYGQALNHIKHSSYKNIQSIYHILKDKEDIHNKKVSEYFSNIIPKIRDKLHSATLLQDVNFIHQRIRNDEIDD